MTNLDLYEELYRLKCQKDSVQWSGFEKEPDKDSFKKYVKANLIDNPKNHLYLLIDGNTNKVMGYSQINEEADGICEGRGSGLFKEYQGCGLASEMSILLLEKARDLGMSLIYGWCSEKNFVSINALKDAGYIKTDIYEIRHLSVFNEDHKFYKWIHEL